MTEEDTALYQPDSEKGEFPTLNWIEKLTN